jgi:hypothetical protein
MSFTFKELLSQQNKKKKKKSKKSKQKRGDGDNDDDDDDDDDDNAATTSSVALGRFPASVHKLWSLRQRGWETAPAPKALPARGGAIAICLIVVDKLPHEGFWRRWFAGGGGNDPRGRVGRMHVHAKHPEKVRASQPWVGERTLRHSYCPEWNDIKVVRAALALLVEALSVGTAGGEEGDLAQFIYIGTESCVPIVPFSTAADVMWSSGRSGGAGAGAGAGGEGGVAREKEVGRSFVHAWPAEAPPNSLLQRPTKFEQQSQFGVVDAALFPPTAVWKALPGWQVLSRQHAQAIVDLEGRVGGELWPAFEPCFAPEEIFLPSCLALAGYRPDPDADAAAARAAAVSSSSSSSSSSSGSEASASTAALSPVVPRSLIFSEWPKSGANRANPIAWDGTFDRAMLRRLRRDGFVLARKFKEPLSGALQDLFLAPPDGGSASGGSRNRSDNHAPPVAAAALTLPPHSAPSADTAGLSSSSSSTNSALLSEDNPRRKRPRSPDDDAGILERGGS